MNNYQKHIVCKQYDTSKQYDHYLPINSIEQLLLMITSVDLHQIWKAYTRQYSEIISKVWGMVIHRDGDKTVSQDPYVPLSWNSVSICSSVSVKCLLDHLSTPTFRAMLWGSVKGLLFRCFSGTKSLIELTFSHWDLELTISDITYLLNYVHWGIIIIVCNLARTCYWGWSLMKVLGR